MYNLVCILLYMDCTLHTHIYLEACLPQERQYLLGAIQWFSQEVVGVNLEQSMIDTKNLQSLTITLLKFIFQSLVSTIFDHFANFQNFDRFRPSSVVFDQFQLFATIFYHARPITTFFDNFRPFLTRDLYDFEKQIL